jgi:hypothetical protein
MIVRNEVAYPDAAGTKQLLLIRASVVVAGFAAFLYLWSQLSSVQHTILVDDCSGKESRAMG